MIGGNMLKATPFNVLKKSRLFLWHSYVDILLVIVHFDGSEMVRGGIR